MFKDIPTNFNRFRFLVFLNCDLFALVAKQKHLFSFYRFVKLDSTSERNFSHSSLPTLLAHSNSEAISSGKSTPEIKLTGCSFVRLT